MIFLELDEMDRLHLARALTLYRRRIREDGLRFPSALEELVERFGDRGRQQTTPLAPAGDEVDPRMEMGPQLYDLDETAARLRLSTRQVQRLIAEGRLVAVRIGSATRVRPEDLERFLTSLNGVA